MRQSIKITALVTLLCSVLACQKEGQPNYQYMPNMYESAGYETYGDYSIFENITGGSSAMLPADGSIARGWMPYEYENSPEGLASAKANLTNPLAYTEENVKEGEALYTIYCGICHGKNGDGQGVLFEREKILGIPAYNDVGRAITEGSVFHVMYFGLNTMGSYATQMTEHEMWQVDHYVMSLKDKLDKKEARAYEEEVIITDNHDEDEGHGEEIHETEDHNGEENHGDEDNDESH